MSQLSGQEIDSSDYAHLFEIASKCYEENGSVIYRAYSLLNDDQKRAIADIFPVFCQNNLNELGSRSSKSGAFKIELKPNPVNDYLFINGLNSKIKEIHVLNLDGRLLETMTINATEYRLNLSSLIPGVYILELINDRGEQLKRKIVKQ